MSALDEFAKFSFEHGKTLMAHKEAALLWQEAQAELAALRARAEKAEKKLDETKKSLEKYKSRANHINAWGDFLYDIHRVLGLAYDSNDPCGIALRGKHEQD